jgi:UDP-N-acetylglucosamine 4-epimerase
MLQVARDVTGVDIPAQYSAPREGDVRDSLADLERAKRLIGYEPRVGLREGLERTWAWMQARLAAEVAALPTARRELVTS